MKKSLLATTALAALGAVAVAGPATAAEKIKVSVGGYMEQWFGYADSKESVQANSDGFDQQSDGEIHFKGSTTLDNGIKIGINVQLEAQGSADTIDEQFAYVEGSFGRINLGSENAASYLMHYGIPSMGAGLDSGDSANWVALTEFTMARTNGRGLDNDAEKLTYFTPRFSGFQLGASYVPSIAQDNDIAPAQNDGVRDDSFSVAMNFNRAFGDIKVMASAGYQDFGDDDGVAGQDLESYQFGLRLGFGGFGIAGTYGEEDRANGSFGAADRARLGVANDQLFAGTQETFGAGVNYAAGPFGVSLAYIGAEIKDLNKEQDVFELGAKYILGPGVEARGSIYYSEGEEGNADLAEGYAVVGGLKLGF